MDDPPVVDDDHGQCHVILQPQSQLFRRGRLLGCPGKDGQLAGVFQHGVLHVLDAGDALLPQFLHQLIDGKAVLPHGVLLQLAAPDQDRGRPADQRPQPQAAERQLTQQQ